MTLNLPDLYRYEFLDISYGPLSFLLNRSQFHGSVYLDSFRKIHTRFTYLDSLIEYDGKEVLVFDLDRFLKKTFHVESDKAVNLVLLSRVRELGRRNKKIFQLLIRDKDFLRNDIFAYKIGSFAEICRLPLREFILFPEWMKNNMDRKGILACRFDGGKINYLVDAETVSFNSLLDSRYRI